MNSIGSNPIPATILKNLIMHNYVITGSHASKLRDAVDLDVMYYGNRPDIPMGKSFRMDFHEVPWNIVFILSANADKNRIISIDDLYTLKLSHVFWPINHEKTIHDIIMLSRQGCKINYPLFHILKKYWTEVHGDKDFLSLKKNKDDFFNDYVKKVVDHDLIHTWVAKYDEPLYKRCLADGETVLTDWNKFQTLPHEDQVHMIREEIMTIGIERFGILNNFETPSGMCYNKAMRLTITNLLKNEFANFMAFNLDEIASYSMKNEYKKAKQKYKELKNECK